MAVTPLPKWEVTINSQKALEQLMDRKFTHPRTKFALLPYYNKLSKWLDDYLHHLELGILTAVLVNELTPTLCNYLSFLEQYIDRCGLRFTKDQHIKLIKLCYFLLTKENQWRDIIAPTARLLVSLIDGSRLTWEDLILDWQPVYILYRGVQYGKLTYLKGVDITTAVYKLKRFYDPKQIFAIWEELQVLISPHDRMNQFCDMCVRFLPVHMTGEEQRQFGAVHWWDTLWCLFSMVEQNGAWGDSFLLLFSTLSRFAPNFKDLSPYYEEIFTRILRAMGLPMRSGKIVVGDSTSSTNLVHFARWAGDLLGGPQSCQPQLSRLMKCMEIYLHPSNNGDHTGLILEFMKEVTDRVKERVYHERVKTHKRKVPLVYFLKEDDLVQFVECMLQPTLVALFNEDVEESTMACEVLRNLAALQPGVVLPKYLEQTYAALHAVCEPQRLTHTLNCLIGVVYQLAADTNLHQKRVTVRNLSEEINKIRTMAENHRLSVREKNWLESHQSQLTLRYHLIHLLEALVSAVDINNILKTIISLQNIMLIYYLIPNVDASECIKLHNDLTVDEKELCKLTKKLPGLVDTLFNKLLQIIQCLAVCAPKNSTELLGSLNDEQTSIGDHEFELMKSTEKVVTVVFSNSSEPIAAALVEKMFNFIMTNEFVSQVTTGMTFRILQEMVFSRPECFPRFAAYVLKNLKSIFTPEVRKQKELNHTALWFVNLASALFATTSQTFIRNKEMCIEIIDILTSCESRVAHEAGTTSLYSSLFMLTRTYMQNGEQTKQQLRRPLSQWIPTREWAKVYQEHELDITWHVPDESCKKTAEELIIKFVFPMLDKIADAKTDRFSLRRYTNQLYYGYMGAYNCFPLPDSAKGSPLNPLPSSLPRVKLGPSAIPLIYWNMHHPTGQNVREMIVDVCEKIIDRFDNKKKDDYQVLTMLSALLKVVLSDTNVDQSQYSSANNQCTEIFAIITNPLDNGKRVVKDAVDAYMSALHFHTVCTEQSYHYAPFHQRVFNLYFKLAVHDYPEVRAEAQTSMLALLGDFPRARGELIQKTVAVLRDQNVSDEKLKGALSMIIAYDWATTCKAHERLLLWTSLTEMRMSELPEITESVEKIWYQIGNIVIPQRQRLKEGLLEEFCEQWWGEMKKEGVWKRLATKKDLEISRKEWKRYVEERKKYTQELISTLLKLSKKRDRHHKRQKLIRTMLWRCQREKANAETITLLLANFLNDEEYLRDRSAEELAYWLKKNKPKTRRIEWTCPQRDPKAPPLMCGIRTDNLVVAYDSQNLPNTEEKWNKTIFISKQQGCYKWPKRIKVVVPASESQLERGPLSDTEKNIVTWFEKKQNLYHWISRLLVEKCDEKGVNDTTCNVIKYMLRNFPDHPTILVNVKEILADLMRNRERNTQRLAAELFIGISKGTRHRSFKELDKLWKWLAPEVNRIIDRLNSEAKENWREAIATILSGEDPRRFYWLIEQLIAGMKRPSSAYHQVVRSTLIPATKWRDIEIRNRINEIVWSQLPKATIDCQRVAISASLGAVCGIANANLFNDFTSVPDRFRLKKPDAWLTRFREELAVFDSSKSDTELLKKWSSLQKPKSETNLMNIQQTKSQAMNFKRALLSFLMQYYDRSITCLSPEIMKLFPMLVNHANDDEIYDLHVMKDFDVQVVATTIVYDYMSSVLLTESFADEMLTTTFNLADTWKIRVTILKFTQTLVFSNIYVCERGNRAERVSSIIFAGLVDTQIEVRQEAARCLEALTHFDFIKTNDALVQHVCIFLNYKDHRFVHGAILGLGAIVMAHPYRPPPLEILPCIQKLCCVSSKHADLQLTATHALREFRRSHRDDWERTSQILGTRLVYLIENAISPLYYA